MPLDRGRAAERGDDLGPLRQHFGKRPLAFNRDAAGVIDGALVEFSGVVSAVRCAIKIQEALALRNANVSPDRRLEFRVGVNLADVIEANDIYGDGVNIAVRLEGFAAPGGICITAETWRYVRGKISASVVDLGEKQLKNISEPARVYAIGPPLDA